MPEIFLNIFLIFLFSIFQNVFEKTKKLALIIVEGQEKVDFEDNGAIVVFRGKRAIGGIAIAVGAMGAGVGITAIAGGVGIYVSHKDLQTKIDWLNQRLDRLERTDLLHTMTMINVSETIGKQSHFITNEYDQLVRNARDLCNKRNSSIIHFFSL